MRKMLSKRRNGTRKSANSPAYLCCNQDPMAKKLAQAELMETHWV
ncbi:MAG: hypothetical protein ACE5QF_01200 [Thermoplasmata archaeon]